MSALPPTNKTLDALTTDNWPLWSSKFEALMTIANLSDLLHDKRKDSDFVLDSVEHAAWKAKTKKCLSHMIIHIGDSYMLTINDSSTANAAWTKISDRMTALSQLGAASLYSKLHSHKKTEQTSVQDHIDHMNQLRRRLQSSGNNNEINETHYLTTLVNSFPTTIHNAQTITALSRMINNGTLDMNELMIQMLEAERTELATRAATVPTQQAESEPRDRRNDEPHYHALATSSSSSHMRFEPGHRAHMQHNALHKSQDRSAQYKSRSFARCEYCHRQNHSKSRCFILNGYPVGHPLHDPTFKPQTKPENVHVTTAQADVPYPYEANGWPL